MRQVPLRIAKFIYENMYHLPSPEDPCTTTDAVYDYFPRQQLNNYFHYARIPWMRQVPLRTCTTTVAKIASTSTVAVNNYFPRRLEPLRKRTLRRYNPETPSVDRMHVLYEMHPMFAPCPFASCTFLLVRHADEPWEPGNRDHPTISSMFRTSARLLLHRYLHELPGPECCRGTIFVSPPWHPFCSAMVTKCFITCSCQHFHKIA